MALLHLRLPSIQGAKLAHARPALNCEFLGTADGLEPNGAPMPAQQAQLDRRGAVLVAQATEHALARGVAAQDVERVARRLAHLQRDGRAKEAREDAPYARDASKRRKADPHHRHVRGSDEVAREGFERAPRDRIETPIMDALNAEPPVEVRHHRVREPAQHVGELADGAPLAQRTRFFGSCP